MHELTELASMGGDTSADDTSTARGPTLPPVPYELGHVEGPLTPAELRVIDAWWRAANYLAVGQIYLIDEPDARASRCRPSTSSRGSSGISARCPG